MTFIVSAIALSSLNVSASTKPTISIAGEKAVNLVVALELGALNGPNGTSVMSRMKLNCSWGPKIALVCESQVIDDGFNPALVGTAEESKPQDVVDALKAAGVKDIERDGFGELSIDSLSCTTTNAEPFASEPSQTSCEIIQ